MIVSAPEAQAMMGWAAILALRILDMIDDRQTADEITIEEVLKSPRTEGLFDLARGITPEVRKTITIVIEAITDIRPNLLRKEGARYVVV